MSPAPDCPPWFHDTVSALVYSFATASVTSSQPELRPPYNDLTRFVLQQYERLPDYLRGPMLALTLGFDLSTSALTGSAFHNRAPAERAKQIAAWKQSRLTFRRDLMRYYESLTTVALYARHDLRFNGFSPKAPAALDLNNVLTDTPGALRCQVAVIGSGPGGAITACLLAEAGRNVVLIEEGPYLSLDSAPAFSIDEMQQKYRNGGQTVALGRNKIAYVEGRCVGGGSEINSGLYHRTPTEILERWRTDFKVTGLEEAALRPHFEACERELSVSLSPNAAPPAAIKLHEGAQRLGWKSFEVPRWFKFADANSSMGKRQSMTETYLPRFVKAGGTLIPGARAASLRQEGGGWIIYARHESAQRFKVEAETVFVCAGAVQTPALLRRSGITRNIGNSLKLHPTVKVVAKFPEVVNSEAMGVPTHQVKEFAPQISLGCSISSKPYLGLGLHEFNEDKQRLSEDWPNLANYYAMVAGEGFGTVRTPPGFRDAVVRYGLTRTDRKALAEGLRKLCEALFAGGASAIYPGAALARELRSLDDLKGFPERLAEGSASLMTIHLFSSCPMGEDRKVCATDSFGRVHGQKNLRVADASLLCTAPGVNPQGTIMALARRNALHFLETNQ